MFPRRCDDHRPFCLGVFRVPAHSDQDDFMRISDTVACAERYLTMDCGFHPNSLGFIHKSPGHHHVQSLLKHRRGGPEHEPTIRRRQFGDRQRLNLLKRHATIMALRRFFKPFVAVGQKCPGRVCADESVCAALQRMEGPRPIVGRQVGEKRDLVKHELVCPGNQRPGN